MRRNTRRLSASAFALVVCLLLAAPNAHAAATLSVSPSFPSPVRVGEVNRPASISLTNANTDPDVALTVCNVGDVGPCLGNEGVTLLPSCGGQNFTTACNAFDPGVFEVHTPAVGRAGTACAGMEFTAAIIEPSTGKVQLTPVDHQHIRLPAPGSTCRIDFTIDVLSFPDIDARPVAPGLQTLQIAEALAVTDGFLATFGRGATSGIAVKGAPTLSSTASPDVTIGGQVSDSATLAGEYNPAAGSMTFKLYGRGDETCSQPPVYTTTVAVNPDGTASSPPFTPSEAGTHRWIASYGGDANNEPASGACNDPGETVTVARSAPAMTANASPAITIGAQVTDTATLIGEHNPTAGDVTFRLYGPGDPTCAAPPAFSSTVTIAADGTATSASFTPSTAGTYRWVASYAGDTNNRPAAGACNDAGGTVVVAKATPAISTSASPGVTVGGSVSDLATLADEHNPTGGSITFKLYGPGDAGCAAAPAFESTVSVSPGGTATSGDYQTTAPGTYRWIASYGGDVNNQPASGACNDAGGSVAVVKAAPTLAATASQSVAVGGSLTDAVRLAGEYNPTSGSVSFRLYGPDDESCSRAAVLSQSVPIGSDGTVTSPAYRATAPGTYRWVAGYAGDANNVAVAGSCGDAGQSAAVTKATPTIRTQASPSVDVGGQVTDTARLVGEYGPVTGEVTFKLYDVGDAACSGTAVHESTVAIGADGTATSGAFRASSAGTYRWVARYAGDANNAAAAGSCNDPEESVTVTKATPSLRTNASPAVAVGGAVSAAIELAGAYGPTSGPVTFRLYGPGDATCSGATVFQAATTIGDDGTAASPAFAPPAAGLYRWMVVYGGDANNRSAGGACNDTGSSVAVGRVSPSIVTKSSPNVRIGGAVQDAASLVGAARPASGSVTFSLYGPADASCSQAPTFVSTVAVNADGGAVSGLHVPSVAGVYRWIARYDGDANNVAATGVCNDPDEIVIVGRATPAIATMASPDADLGDPVRAASRLSGQHGATTGTVTFNLYDTTDGQCAGAPLFSSTVAVGTDGSAASASFVPKRTGTYRWIATYGGDANNAPAAGSCRDAKSTVKVKVPVSPLLCGGTKVALVDVLPRGKGVDISGVARPEYAGKRVRIVLRSTRKTAARATISSTGAFAARARLPKRSQRAGARYYAVLGKRKSTALKLDRRSYLTRAVLRGNRMTFSGRVTGRFRSGTKVTLQRIQLCSKKNRSVKSTKLSKTGRWSITLTAPENAGTVLFRARTKVLAGRRTQPTFTLPQPPSLSSARYNP